MAHTPRIGIQISIQTDHGDPYWAQVWEAIWQQGRSRSAEVVEVAIYDHLLLSPSEQIAVVDELVAQELDALICNTYPSPLLLRILERGIPIIYVSEIGLRHPLLTSRSGLSDAASRIGAFLDARLPHSATVLLVGGSGDGEDSGQSRIDGFRAALAGRPSAPLHHILCGWSAAEAHACTEAFLLERPELSVDAIFGLSDALALAAAEAARPRAAPGALLLGINGDPLALAAIADGRMTATIETDVDDIAGQALDLAVRAARREPLPPLFVCRQHLITAENVAGAALRKVNTLARLPTRLIDVSRRNEQQRRIQAETSDAIDRKVSLILDEQRLLAAITSLIRDSYGFDRARFLARDPESGALRPSGSADDTDVAASDAVAAGPLAYAVTSGRPVFIPDARASHRFPPDPDWPEVRARVVLPVRLSGQVVGLLDLHHRQVTHHTREELAGLELLADRLAIAIRNAQLYGQELEARELAEQANRLKTTLLANVSHELRTPLNVILGYSRSALDELARGAPPKVADDLRQIYHSGEHLLRLINDLLDLSRAEIGELDLLPERLDPRDLLDDVFRVCAAGFSGSETVAWRISLPPSLPEIDADPVRLRQVLLNLLHNAHKFTRSGAITLGAERAGGELHIWVADTGPGIAPELQAAIFEPFVSADPAARRGDGIGLGLHIARYLVRLHRGRLTLDSEPGAGATFHVYLPLPDAAAHAPAGGLAAIVLVSASATPPPPIADLARRRGLPLRQLRPADASVDALRALRPALIVWDAAAVDGGRAIDDIYAHAELRALPIMIYAGGEADAAGATGVLLKPLAEDALASAVDDLGLSSGGVLIVEDDPQTRALHRRLVAQHIPGAAVRDVADGRAALAAMAQMTPALVILDLMLPDVDGFAVLEALRAEPRTAGVPVLVLSGKALTPDDIRRLSDARVTLQTKDLLSAEELAGSLRRTLSGDERLPAHTSALVKRALAFVQQQYAEPLSRQAIADAVGVHKDYLGRIFLQEVGLSPWEYLVRYRVLRAKAMLRETDMTVAEVATRVGFDTPTYFSQVFHREVGCSPRAFRTGARGEGRGARG